MNLISSPSPHFNERSHSIDMIVLHYTDMKTTQKALEWLINPLSQVSAHYLISEKGDVYALVEESKRAWHAGTSLWKGRSNINNYSIGIEIANPGHSYGHLPFPHAQIDVLIKLCLDIKARWKIPSAHILGHSDVAPQRKQDPGHLFPWKQLHTHGLGMWPDLSSLPTPDLLSTLNKIGYDISSPSHAILAFQRHFQPHKLDGLPDEETRKLAQGLLEKSDPLSSV